jgi:outer membrane protein assembly factor BamA
LIRSSVLNLGIQAGTVDSPDGVHLVDRASSAAGGPRGFSYAGMTPRDSVTDDALGGTNYVSASIEALAPVGNRGIALGAFVDVGSVWSLPDISSSRVDDGFSLRSSVGLTMKWQTTLGYLDISLAAPIDYLESDDKQTFSISFGSEF